MIPYDILTKGWKYIGIRNEHYEKLEVLAKANRRSVAAELEAILAEAGVIQKARVVATGRF